MPLFTPRLPLIGTNGTVTTSTPLLDLSQTWNNAGVTFTGIKANITDTASAAGSFLMDLQVGGASQFSVTKIGRATFANTVYGLNFATTNNSGLFLLGTTNDVVLARDAANTLALRNGVNAQAFNVYNTYTDASNYERFTISANGTYYQIGSTAAGTGLGRQVRLGIWYFESNGNLTAATDNTFDIGASGANRPRVGYFGSGLNVASSGYFTFAASSKFTAPADGLLLLQNNAGTDFTRLQLGGTTNAFPALTRSGNGIQVSLADGSATAAITALDFRMGYGTRLKDNADGVAQLVNSAGTDFTRLQFGGTTNLFPAIKKNGTTFHLRLADDSDYTEVRVRAAQWKFGTRFEDTADGVIQVSNSASSGFSRLGFGGLTSSFPALKPNGTTLEVRLADDSGFTSLSLAAINPAIILVASLPSAVSRAGQMRFVSDALAPVFGSAVTGGGAVNVPVYSDGTVWRVG